MTSRISILTGAVATAVSAMALAQAATGGAAAGGARENPSAIMVKPGGETIRGDEISPGGANRDVPWQGAGSGTATGVRTQDDTAPRVGAGTVDVRPSQQRITATQVPPVSSTTQPTAKGLVPGQVVPGPPAGANRIDVSPGTGGVTSSTGGGAAVVPAPSGLLQQQQQQAPVRGGFGSSTDATVNATPGQPVNPGLDASQIDVTQRTQQLSQQALQAQPAGSTLAPATQPVQQQQGPRPEVPMPAPSGNLAPPAGGATGQ